MIQAQPSPNDDDDDEMSDEMPDIANQPTTLSQPTASNTTELVTSIDTEMLDNLITKPFSSRTAVHHRSHVHYQKPGTSA
ncbi:hypothetical protein AJ78_08421 [Emergomyces pasteurianus Ep9510]|uniref:Uncharacterized protein n=1 Tax=Emergomyces pasteurianus Ep9510 TaxID=1447872 RepID=A0A1J9PRY8_9EURO|nr:hypothetical protein AJ78_08421 [Emergomyces pasteurianus Ep9510]